MMPFAARLRACLAHALLLLVCVLGMHDRVHAQPPPAPLQSVRGVATDLAITPDGTVYVLDTDGVPWVQPLGKGGNWSRLPGAFRAIRAGLDGSVWAITPDGEPYRLQGTWWNAAPLGRLRDLAVAPDGAIYTLDMEGRVSVRGAPGESPGKVNTAVAANFERLIVDEHGLPWLWRQSGMLARYDGTQWSENKQFSSAGIAHMAAGLDGTLLLVDGGGRVQRWNPANRAWESQALQQPMALAAVGPDGKPWYLSKGGELLASEIFAASSTVTRGRVPALFTRLLNWKRVRGEAHWLSVGADGTVVTIDAEQGVWRWQGKDIWRPLPGKFRRTAVSGSGVVWGIDPQNRVWRNTPAQWIDMGIEATEIAAGPRDEVWVIGRDGDLARYDATARQWLAVAGGPARALAAGKEGDFWLIDTAGAVRLVNQANTIAFPGIVATSLAVGPEGTVYATSDAQELFWLDLRERLWKPAVGAAQRVAVGPRGTPWIIGTKNELMVSTLFLAEHDAILQAQAALIPPPRPVMTVPPPPASVLPTVLKPLVYTTIAGAYVDVAVGADGSVFAAGADGGLYCFSNANRRFQLASIGTARRVAVSPNGTPWVINAFGQVAYFERSAWVTVANFKADDLVFAPDASVYATQSGQNTVFRFVPATQEFREVTTYPSGLPLRARRVAIAQNALWAVTPANQVLKCSGTQCQLQTISAVDIAAGPEGSLMVLDLLGSLQRLNPRTGAFTTTNGSGTAVAVGPSGIPWLVGAMGSIQSAGLFATNSKTINTAACAQKFAGSTIPATPQPTVQLTAADDAFILAPGASASILANDRLSGVAPAATAVTVTFTSTNANLTHANGTITVSPNAAPGTTLTGTYTVCALPGATPCSAAKVTVTVGGAIAVADTVTLNPGAGFNLLANDRLNNVAPSAAQVAITFTSASAALTQAGGVLTLAKGAVPGSVHTATYSFCAVGGAPCSGAVSVTITATGSAVAVADNATLSPGATLNLLANDTLNGVAPTAAQVVMTFTPASASLTQAGGVLTLAAGAVPGSVHTGTYSFCAVGGAPCSGTVTVSTTVTAVATAVADTATLNPGATLNLLANDLLNGLAPTAAQVVMTFTPASASLTQAGGVLALAAGAVPGSVHTGTYSFCAVGGAPCSGTVTVSITVTAVATAVADTATLNPGATLNLLANDLLNGLAPTAAQVVMTFTPASASLTQAGGVLTLAAGAVPGSVHTGTYSFCAVGGAPCSGTVTVSTTVTAVATAVADTATLNPGATLNLLANDLLNGLAPTAAQVVMTFTPASASLTQAGGVLTLAASAVPGSVHAATYSFCAVGGAPCSGTVNVNITAASSAVAVADNAALFLGTTFNLLANDLLNGVAPTAGQVTMTFTSANAELTQAGGILTLSAAAIPGNVYTATYSFCALSGAPCSGTVNITVTATPNAVAVADTATLPPGATLNLLANDLLNGAVPNGALVTVFFVSFSAELTQLSGVLTLSPSAISGSVHSAEYSFCSGFSGTPPCSGTVTVTITAQ